MSFLFRWVKIHRISPFGFSQSRRLTKALSALYPEEKPTDPAAKNHRRTFVLFRQDGFDGLALLKTSPHHGKTMMDFQLRPHQTHDDIRYLARLLTGGQS